MAHLSYFAFSAAQRRLRSSLRSPLPLAPRSDSCSCCCSSALRSPYPVRPECSRSECIEGSPVAVACRCLCTCRCRCSESPLMAPRRWCRNRIKKRPLSERSEFRTLPDFGASGVGTPAPAGAPSPGSPSLGYFSWRSKRSDPAAGPDTRLGRLAGHAALVHPPAGLSREAAFDVVNRLHNARRSCNVHLAGEATPLHCRGGKPGIRPGSRPAFCFPKKWGKKATPMMAVRAARGLHTPPSTGTPTATTTATATATAEATTPVGLGTLRYTRCASTQGERTGELATKYCNGNYNGRCAGKGNCILIRSDRSMNSGSSRYRRYTAATRTSCPRA